MRKTYSAVAPRPAAGYGSAIAIVAVATVLRALLDAWLPSTTPYIFITYFPAVLAAAAFGGLGPGLAAVALATVASWFLFLPPGLSFRFHDTGGIIAAMVFAAFASVTAVIAATLQDAMRELDRTLERLEAALDASKTGTWRWMIETDTVEWDQALANVYGIGLESAPKTAAQFLELVHPNDRAQVEMSIADALKYRKELAHEFRTVLSDKSVRWIYDRGRVVRRKDGSPQCLIGACMDITDRKEAEEQKTVLIDELKHRVKNTLAVVQSLVRMTLRGAKDFAQFEENLGGRLAALGAAHALLSGESWRHADLREVLAAQTGAYATAGALEFAGPELAVTPKQAASLGLIAHELMTNAVKYGALSRDGGKVIASWRLEDGFCRMSWKETGGPRPQPQAGAGFGSRLIEMMASDLGGTVEVRYAPAGIVLDLNFPVDPKAAPRGPAGAAPEIGRRPG